VACEGVALAGILNEVYINEYAGNKWPEY